MQVKLVCFSAWQWWVLLKSPHSLDENAVIIAILQLSVSAAVIAMVILSLGLYVVFFQKNEKHLSF